MGSSRLPGKVMKHLGTRTLLGHILYRLSFSQRSFLVIVATSRLTRDDVIESFCNESKTHCFRGSETNVLQRYYQCAETYNFKHIVRLTADNPFTDIEELDRLIDLHMESGADYSHSLPFLPVGVGAEIFSFQALAVSTCEGIEPHHLEHVDEFILENPSRFKTAMLEVPEMKRYPNLRLTVDNKTDYQKACAIMELTRVAEQSGIEEAIRFCLHSV